MRSLVAIWSLLLALSFRVSDAVAGPSGSGDDVSCGDASFEAQKLQRAGKLKAAHEQFATCARDRCAPEVIKFCTGQLAAIEAAQPTVVIAVRDERGQDRSSGTVTIDGEPVPDALGGRAVAVDPGARKIRVEVPDAEPVEQTVVVREGDKARALTFQVMLRPSRSDRQERPIHRSNARTAAWVSGAVGVAALGAFGYFGVRGLSDRKRFGCDVACPADEYDKVNRELLVADIALGVAVVSIGTSTVLFISSSSSSSPQQPQSGVVGVAGVF